MTESIQAAFSYVRARSPGYGIKPSLFQRKDIHITCPKARCQGRPIRRYRHGDSIVSTLTGIACTRMWR